MDASGIFSGYLLLPPLWHEKNFKGIFVTKTENRLKLIIIIIIIIIIIVR